MHGNTGLQYVRTLKSCHAFVSKHDQQSGFPPSIVKEYCFVKRGWSRRLVQVQLTSRPENGIRRTSFEDAFGLFLDVLAVLARAPQGPCKITVTRLGPGGTWIKFYQWSRGPLPYKMASSAGREKKGGESGDYEGTTTVCYASLTCL